MRLLAVHQDLPGLRVIKAQQQRNERGFAGTAGADERNLFAGTDAEGNALEDFDFRARRIAKMDVAKFNFAVQGVAGRGLGRHGTRHGHREFRLFLQQFPDAVRGADGFLDLAVKIGELAHRTRHKRGVEDKAGHFADADLSSLQQRRPGPEDQHDGAEQGEKTMKAMNAPRNLAPRKAVCR